VAKAELRLDVLLVIPPVAHEEALGEVNLGEAAASIRARVRGGNDWSASRRREPSVCGEARSRSWSVRERNRKASRRVVVAKDCISDRVAALLSWQELVQDGLNIVRPWHVASSWASCHNNDRETSLAESRGHCILPRGEEQVAAIASFA